jgi:hypothetical protein
MGTELVQSVETVLLARVFGVEGGQACVYAVEDYFHILPTAFRVEQLKVKLSMCLISEAVCHEGIWEVVEV